MRPGHHRPIGTTTKMRFPDWPDDHWIQPRLGDIACQTSGPEQDDADLVRRAYLVVGIEETRTGYRFLMERIEYGAIPEPPCVLWMFHNVPRPPRATL